ncbi:MAG: hypothetical protein DI622_05410, partial [Chryseobacterium sp.]
TELSTETTEYLDGFQYSGGLQNGPKGSTLFRTNLAFYPTSEGYYDFIENRYIYNYTDHLGNVRLSYFKNGSEMKVLEENNYYPFGLKHDGYNPTFGNLAYQYKYNGKELQADSGMYDYGARFYMPDIGRWGVVDPLAEKMTRHSPYNYAFNNPIRFIDPDGREGTGWIHQKYENGQQNLIYRADINTTQEAMDAGYTNVYGVSSTGEVTDRTNGNVHYSLNEDGTFTNTESGESSAGAATTNGGIYITGRGGFDLTKYLSNLGNEGGDFYTNLGGAAPLNLNNPFFRGGIDKIVSLDGFMGGMVNSLSRGNDLKDLMSYRVDITSLADLAYSALTGKSKMPDSIEVTQTIWNQDASKLIDSVLKYQYTDEGIHRFYNNTSPKVDSISNSRLHNWAVKKYGKK